MDSDRAGLRAERAELDQEREANEATRKELESDSVALRDAAERIEAERGEIEAERDRLRSMWDMIENHRKQASGFLAALDRDEDDDTVIDLTETRDDSTI